MNTVVQEHWNGDEDMARGHAAITAEMSTDKVNAREAWITKGDRLNLAVASAAHDNGYVVSRGGGAVNSAWHKILSDARKSLSDHLRTTPEGYVLVPVKPVARMLYWLGKKIETFPHNRIVRTFAEFPKPKEPSKYWREGEPLYMVAPEAIDNAAQEGK